MGSWTDQPSVLSTALCLAPPFLPTTAGFLCSHGLEPQTSVWSFSPSHLQEPRWDPEASPVRRGRTTGPSRPHRRGGGARAHVLGPERW